MTRELPDWSMLQAAISGEVILPESPAYGTARKPAFARRLVLRTPKGTTPYRFADRDGTPRARRRV